MFESNRTIGAPAEHRHSSIKEECISFSGLVLSYRAAQFGATPLHSCPRCLRLCIFYFCLVGFASVQHRTHSSTRFRTMRFQSAVPAYSVLALIVFREVQAATPATQKFATHPHVKILRTQSTPAQTPSPPLTPSAPPAPDRMGLWCVSDSSANVRKRSSASTMPMPTFRFSTSCLPSAILRGYPLHIQPNSVTLSLHFSVGHCRRQNRQRRRLRPRRRRHRVHLVRILAWIGSGRSRNAKE